MKIHAFRRSQPTSVDLGFVVIDFKPNEAGDVVAEVDDLSACEILLEIGEGYRAYGPDAPEWPLALETPGPAEARFRLGDGEHQVDLSAMTDAQVHAFAKSQGLNIHHNTKGERLRQAVVDGLTGG